MRQAPASGSRLVRYGADNGPCFSSSPDGPSASCGPARRSSHPGNNFGSPVWPTRPAATHACALYGNQVLSNSTGVAHCGNREEKVPCSSGTYVGLSAASSVPKLKGTSIGNRCAETEENPPARRLSAAKKEEDFSANRLKKIHQKKIQV